MKQLAESGGTTSVGSRLAELAVCMALTQDLGEIQSLLHEATLVLGAERSFFASVSGDGRDANYAFVLDCDPSWWHRYRSACSLQTHPWLVYASRHSASVLATQLSALAQEQQQAIDIAAAAGFASAALFPVHSGRSDDRVSVLCLGHSVAGYFEDLTFAKLQVGARSLAMELHDWWAKREKQQLAQRTHLSDVEVRLLERHCAGLSSKQIALELQVSRESINSRFQRITSKLGVRNRRAAARIAIECGLIVV